MGIEIVSTIVVRNTFNGHAIEPCYAFPRMDKVKEWMKDNPFPSTPQYSADDFLHDTQSSGSWTLGEYVTEEQKDYIIKALDHFL